MTDQSLPVPTRNVLPPAKKVVRVVVNSLVKLATGIICKVDGKQLERVPEAGPIIVIVNHVNFLELPIIYPRVRTDMGTGYSKAENWDKPFFRTLFNIWSMIPLNREEVDMSAFRLGLEALDQGRILFITPEGTRSHHGRLQKGKSGVALIAQRSGVPVWPIVCYGGEKFSENIKRLRRTEYHVAVGNPFRVNTNGVRVNREMRQQITDEMMYQLAALLPPEYRGAYADMDAASEMFLQFSSPEESNLLKSHIK